MSEKTKSNGAAKRTTIADLARAAASAEADEPEASLPRLLRYALAAQNGRPFLRTRLLREILTLAPDLRAISEHWADDPTRYSVALANALDKLACERDRPPFVTLADIVLLLGLPDDADYATEHRRVAAALAATVKSVEREVDDDLRGKLAELSLGWTILAANVEPSMNTSAVRAASARADVRTQWITWAEAKRWQTREAAARKKEEEEKSRDAAKIELDERASIAPDGYVRICALSEQEVKAKKLKDVLTGHEHIVNRDVPLAATPDIAALRDVLVFEFPYATDAIDRLLGDLVGRQFVYLNPTILVGEAGGGKSRLSRRLAELLGAGSWRCDASTADGSVIGGTARRWYSAEPNHAFLAISRARFANPVVTIDEVEKAATRSDYGRFWDSLLGLLERETAARYPDPALQTPVNVSHVSYLGTANAIDPLPAPLRDRMRVIRFPSPRAVDLDALLPPVIDELARDRGLDARWIEPLTGADRDAVAAFWPGGSVRRLRRLVEVILTEREVRTSRH